MAGEISFEILFGKVPRQRLAGGQARDLADPSCESGRQSIEGRSEISARIHAAHQTLGLLQWRTSVAQRLWSEIANAHALDKIRCAEVVRPAFRAKHRLRKADQCCGASSCRDQAAI